MGSLRFAHGAGFMGWLITTNSYDLLHHKQNMFDKILNLKEKLDDVLRNPKKTKKKTNIKKRKKMFNKKSGFLEHEIGLSNASVLYLFTSSPWPRPFVRTLRMIQKKTSWCYGIISYWYVYINHIMRIYVQKYVHPSNSSKPKIVRFEFHACKIIRFATRQFSGTLTLYF